MQRRRPLAAEDDRGRGRPGGGARGRRPWAAVSSAAAPTTRRPRPTESPPPPLPVEKVQEDVIVAAWAEPSRLPPAGGQTQILVRLQKRGGVPFPGVQVRLQTSAGSLYSGGQGPRDRRRRPHARPPDHAHVRLHHPQRGRHRVPVPGAGRRAARELARPVRPTRRRPRPRPREAARARARAVPAHRPRRALRGRLDLPDDPEGRRAAARPRRGAGALRLRARAPPAPDPAHGGDLALRPGGDGRHPRGAGAAVDGLPRPRRRAGASGASPAWSAGTSTACWLRWGRRLGPDPASIDACMIGGIVANNSSGMCCGVAQNSYHSLDALHFMLADGTVIDTARPDADEDLRRDRPDLHAAPPRPARRGARGRRALRAHPQQVLAQADHGLRAERPARPRHGRRRSSPT